MGTFTTKFKLNGLERQYSFQVEEKDLKQKQAEIDLLLADLGAQATAESVANVASNDAEVKCADCGNVCEPTTAFGRAPAYTALQAAQKRSEKIADSRNAKEFAGLNLTPRLLCATCNKPYRERLDAKFRNR